MEFNDSERSWEIFKLLEAHRDGMGNWRVMDVLGKPVVDLPEDLNEDLLTWRYLTNIARRLRDKANSPNGR